MDFVVWCDHVLKTLLEMRETTPTARDIGADEFTLSQALSEKAGVADFRTQPATYRRSIFHAISSLKATGCIENHKHSTAFWKISRVGQKHVANPIPLWSSICQEELEPDHEQLLSLINRLSQHTTTNHVWLEEVEHNTIMAELGWTAETLWNVAKELYEWEFVTGFFSAAGTVRLQTTYKGAVWETKQGFTLDSQLINQLLDEGETTSVEFKQEVHLDTADQKAEFVKDILSLANTRASGQRWLIIGVTNKTSSYFGPPDATVTSERIEQILARYTVPCVDIHYKVVDAQFGSASSSVQENVVE